MANYQRLRNAPGLTPENICIRLSELAKEVPADEAIVEIGVYRGRTVSYLGYGARLGEGAAVYGIDPWDLQDQRTQSREQRRLRFADAGTRRIAEQTVQQQGMRGYVTLIRGFSTQVAETWTGPKVGLLYVDGDHARDSVIADVSAWLPHLADGAVLAFDDYGTTHNPGVVEAVNALVEEGLLVVEEVIDGQLAIATLAAGHDPVDTPASEKVEGVEVIDESGTAGAGEAVNADTGEVTAPGEPLPEIPPDQYAEDAEPIPPSRKVAGAELPPPPPRSGAGSGVENWREYAVQVTSRPAQTWANLNRQEIIDELTGMGIIE